MYINIPADIKDPADVFSLSVMAIGVQIYKAKEVAPGQFEWAFKAPEAELFDSNGLLVGRHFLDDVNGGPAWVLNDGSKVVANTAKEVVKRHEVENSIPWLRLPKKENKGNGALSQINSIQRLQTLGGKPPLAPPDKSQEGKELRVYYTATYYFNK